MDLLKVSETRHELASRLLERMSPLFDKAEDLPTNFNPKVFIEFGSVKEDYHLIWDLFDALVGDAVIFKTEHEKGKDSSLA